VRLSSGVPERLYTKKKKMDDELPSARFATVDEAEFRRILNEKDAKNTR
jgi:hypothetical protein